jgi:hypothetical protein
VRVRRRRRRRRRIDLLSRFVFGRVLIMEEKGLVCLINCEFSFECFD